MKKKRKILITVLFGLTVNFLIISNAFADAYDAGSDDGSDCGCSESGSSISASESSGWGTGYGTQTAGATDSVQQEAQAVQADSQDSVNLIWVNFISATVVAGIIVMLIRYRKSTKTEKKDD